MSIVTEITSVDQFIAQFAAYGRENQYTYDGFKALFEYLDEASEEEDIKLDVIGLCCEFAEYCSVKRFVEWNREYWELWDTSPADVREELVLEQLQKQYLILELDSGGVLVSQ